MSRSVATEAILASGTSTASPPSFPDVGVIALVPERWGGLWLSRHQVLTRLSRYFHVLWCNPPLHWRASLSRQGPPRGDDPTPPPTTGFRVHEHARWLPEFHRRGAIRRATERERLRQARRALERAGCTKFILYLWQPRFAESLDLVDHDLSCYHIVDEYSYSDVEQPLSDMERRLIERVDQVIVHSPALLEKKGNINTHTVYITNGVDYAAFAAEVPPPADLSRIPRPRIGYIGRLKSQMDWTVLVEIARRRADWSLVLVGPVGHMGDRTSEKDALLALPNVHYLGNRSVRELPAYTRHMDVCLLCYARTDYTKYIFPLKLHEYLASGRPVVGSDIRALKEFAHVVRIARSPEEWCGAIAESLSPLETSPERVEERRRVARAYDWNTLTGRIAAVLGERLGPTYAERLAAATRKGTIE